MKDAPVHATATVGVATSPDRVWELLAEAATWPSWYPDIREVAASRPLELGDTFTFKTGPVAVEATVDASQPGELLSFTGRSRGATALYAFRLEAADGSTVVHAEQSMSGPAARTMRPMLQKIAETSLPAWLEALRVRAEGGQ